MILLLKLLISRDVGFYEDIKSAKLLNFVIHSRPFVLDVVLEFYSNLSLSMFDIKSLEYQKGFVRGRFIDFS